MTISFRERTPPLDVLKDWVEESYRVVAPKRLVTELAGLGVVMTRAVRERRRSIGVLRALGFQSSTVQRAFLTESLFVTLEGVVLGTALSIITTYLLFKNYELFQSAAGWFSIPWLSITILIVAATAASVLATVWPARQASRIKPVVALRIE